VSNEVPIDADEFRKMVEAHQRMVFSIALRITGEPQTAEEVAQDTFFELFRSADRLTSGEHVLFWLRRVAVHRATDALRRKSHRPESSAEEWIAERHDVAALPDDASGLDGITQEKIQDLLAALPDSNRVAIVLRYQEDMTPDEIARLLDQPLATVKSQLQRGLQLLRRKAAVTMKEYIR
jgi:RNA polymerase sigma-70 factor, ECF subfamily